MEQPPAPGATPASAATPTSGATPASGAVPARSLDARGLRCPLPLVRARNEIERVAPGEMLEVLATDPGADHDFRAWTRRSGHELVSAEELPGPVYHFLLRRR